MVDHHEQLEVGERSQRELLVGERDGRVAAADDQRPHPALAGREDLLGERGGGHLAAVAAQIHGCATAGRWPGRAAATTWARCGVSGIEQQPVLEQVALTVHPAEDRVEHDDEVLGEARP